MEERCDTVEGSFDHRAHTPDPCTCLLYTSHYLALLRKGDEKAEAKRLAEKTAATKGSARKRGKKLPEDLELFFQDISWEMDANRLDIHGERVYYMPEDLPDVKGIRFLRTGLLLGELKKNRFEPSQALAMCLKKEEYKKIIDISSEDDRISRYLKGETLEVDDLADKKAKGWHLVCVDGYPPVSYTHLHWK